MAVQAYEEALKLDPNNAKTYYNLALALDKVGDLKRASGAGKIDSTGSQAGIDTKSARLRKSLEILAELKRGKLQR